MPNRLALVRVRFESVTAIVTVSLMMSAADVARASAASCSSGGTRLQSPGTISEHLSAVRATSACNAWAVGSYLGHGRTRTLIANWNGKDWKLQASPNPGGSGSDDSLAGLSAIGPRDAWAVGDYGRGGDRTLIEHWNGHEWKVQPSPTPGPSSGLAYLYGASAASSTDVWAVGSYFTGTHTRTLIEHWNGHKWKVQPSPNPGNGDELESVAVVSSTDAWAAGDYLTNSGQFTLIEHWNGKSWKVQPTPNLSSFDSNQLFGVTAASEKDAWAVGYYSTGSRGNYDYDAGQSAALILHWNGHEWKAQPSPSSGSGDRLAGVAAASPSDVWAVGSNLTKKSDGTLIDHWDGHAWSVQTSPNPGSTPTFDYLTGVAAVSSTDAWAVGSRADGQATLVERWDGHAWTG